MELNWYIILATGLIPNIVGFVWYGPLFGKEWMKESGISPDPANVNMVKLTLFTLLFGVLLALALTTMVIHQMAVQSALMSADFSNPDSEVYKYFLDFMSRFGDNFRTFKHGALHGLLAGITVFFPVIGCNAMYEGKSWKYIFINTGFWTACAIIMGGIICAFA
ncbi:MAG: DUF1761 domain-containing protein [Saprospiraceae bacterium]